jgi:hypothetical protein
VDISCEENGIFLPAVRRRKEEKMRRPRLIMEWG